MTVLDNWRSRTALLWGEDGAGRIAEASVLVAGVGAVGSMAVEALARSGVGTLALVDFDCVEPSNVNRQLCALSSTVGRRKCDVAAARVADINPSCSVTAVCARIPCDTEGAASFLREAGRFNVIVDAIDDVEAKASLIAAAIGAGVPVVSSMGAARRFDPTRVRCGALGEVTGCPLAKSLRRALRERFEAMGQGMRPDTIPDSSLVCVYSTEPPARHPRVEGLPPRAMGSSICVTGAFGLCAANAALRIVVA